MDAALAAAREVGPDLVVASDPDADRCAVAVPDVDADGGWRMLRGDDVGALLGAHVLARGLPAGGVLASSIVSSRVLGAMSAEAGSGRVETLTGFKWIARVPGLAYGYEEALGYCVAPDVVRDKDGISAALLVAELAAGLRAAGRCSICSTSPVDSGSTPHRRVLGPRRGSRPHRAPARSATGGPAHDPGGDTRGAGRRPRGRRRRVAPHRGPALSPRRSLPGDRATLGHRAQAQGLPRGDRTRARRRRPGRGTGHRQRSAGQTARGCPSAAWTSDDPDLVDRPAKRGVGHNGPGSRGFQARWPGRRRRRRSAWTSVPQRSCRRCGWTR